jgi:hypothetical protein
VFALVLAAVIPKPDGMAMLSVLSSATKFPLLSTFAVATIVEPDLTTSNFAAMAVFAAMPATNAAVTSACVLLAVVSGTTTETGEPVTFADVNVIVQFPALVHPEAATTVAVSTCATPATNAALPVKTPVCTSSVAVVLDVVKRDVIAYPISASENACDVAANPSVSVPDVIVDAGTPRKVDPVFV